MKTIPLSALSRCCAVGGLVLATLCPSLAAQEPLVLEGRLSVLWGDPGPTASAAEVRLLLTSANGVQREIEAPDPVVEAAGGLVALNGRQVSVTLARSVSPPSETVVDVRLTDSPPDSIGGVIGSKPWVTVACKFSDIAAEPKNLAYFQGMYDNAPGRLDHYWREVSYDAIDVVGSLAVDWVNLPNPQSFYVPTPGSGTSANLNALFDDCTAAADPFVDYSKGGTGGFEGINLMFNDLLDCCAWGGSRFATLDGVSKSWRTTWNPPWAFAQEAVIAHEMGHGFGLPHANNSDGDGDPYDSPWDVMSSAAGYAVDDPVYGNLGKHVTTYHKDVLGWLDPAEVFELEQVGSHTLEIDPLGSATTSDYRMARIQITGSNHYYTVEVREAVGDYEADIPGTGAGDRKVIIHEVLTSRSQPAWVVDADVPPADYADTEGVMWRTGETFVDPANEIAVEILAETATGFMVRISLGAAIFVDGFESGDTSAWSSTVP